MTDAAHPYACPRPPVLPAARTGNGLKMTDDEVRRAHRAYLRGETTVELGARLWREHGFASPSSCASSLGTAFSRLGLSRRPAGRRPGVGRRLTSEQVQAAHVLYVRGGLSLRKLGAMLAEPYGYASPRSCANCLHDAFKAAGLPCRDRIAATVAASTTHGRGARADRAAYKRWHRAEFGPWPSDRREHR